MVATQAKKGGTETHLVVAAVATAVQLKGLNLNSMPQPQGSMKSSCWDPCTVAAVATAVQQKGLNMLMACLNLQGSQ